MIICDQCCMPIKEDWNSRSYSHADADEDWCQDCEEAYAKIYTRIRRQSLIEVQIAAALEFETWLRIKGMTQ